MSNLNDLANDFCELVKQADDTYGVDEKCAALINNLKIVHHQISKSGVGKFSPEAKEHADKCLGYLVKAIYEMQTVKRIVTAPPDEAQADTELFRGPETLRSVV